MKFSEIMTVINGLTKQRIDEGLNDWGQTSDRNFLEVHNMKNWNGRK
jgi:hypothetical protein